MILIKRRRFRFDEWAFVTFESSFCINKGRFFNLMNSKHVCCNHNALFGASHFFCELIFIYFLSISRKLPDAYLYTRALIAVLSVHLKNQSNKNTLFWPLFKVNPTLDALHNQMPHEEVHDPYFWVHVTGS